MPKCPECKALYGTGDDFCPECGKRLKKEKEEKPGSTFNKSWVITVSIIIVSLFVLFFLISTSSRISVVKPSPQIAIPPELSPETETKEEIQQEKEKEQLTKCEPPKITYEGQCCLDADSSGVCDIVEEALKRTEALTKAEQIKKESTEGVCYKYRTAATTLICLKKDTLHEPVDVCAINNDNLIVENSESPIQITDGRESSSGANRINIDLTVENKKAGSVYEPGAFKDKCVPDEAKKEEDIVYVELTDPAKRLNFKCSGLGDDNKGHIKLYDDKRQVSCTLDTQGLQDEAYEQRVDITIDYFYVE